MTRATSLASVRRRLVAALALACTMLVAGCGESGGAPRRVVIPKGATFREATDSLASAGLIGSPRLFRLFAKLSGRDRAIKAGTYVLEPGASWGALLDDLVKGRSLVYSVTIPEGWALAQTLALVERELHVDGDSLEAAVRDTALLRRLDVPTPTVEGYLFPATYVFPAGTGARTVVEEMVRRFEQVWTDEWSRRAAEIGMSRHDVVTLASIVEKEVRHAEERPVVAAVYHNRLKRGMRLQADPTVQYALGKHVSRVLYRDLLVESPYNTYRVAGLPPGPIAAPGEASLRATLWPAQVPFLFFVATPDGHHVFRETFREHAEAIRAIRGGGSAVGGAGNGGAGASAGATQRAPRAQR